ncbi:hypothetical protein DSCO28_05660 [Desulfosarcina ovata subsp. sediminis]|uniref:Polyketide synthase n=1 Tax=Desulfosarcina ovata subsp. sediminis TaxID=885957 RepID=A0A5K7ZN82_9BACT|nr:type I polyketide synthase [Desulfosarcina ovata]BBO80000.1 hypothetical protein DSCO28_05660 [Desulfosarcina ovata subsp. sediminis]
MKKEKKPAHPLIAIIGMGGMFAQSENLKAYWRTLVNGIDCISDPPASHGQLNACFDPDPKRPDHIYCKRGGFLPTLPFDPTEFGIPPAAIEATDTSQLLGLVGAKMALQDAGYGDNREFDRQGTSVILGVTGTQELVISLGSRLGHPFWRRALDNKGLSDQQKSAIINEIADSYVPWQESSFPGLLGNVVAGRICNRLNLGGTNCVVDAACASSLSAIHLSLMELYTGKSNMAVTGGVDTLNDIFMHMCFSKTGVLSHSGDARPFSSQADGTVLGEGIGILVLKRLADAERDGDRIYAVIRGIGSASDGKSQSIYAPLSDGQARALTEAYHNAGIAPETVDLIEAHGTGTRVGDGVEFSALRNVFSKISNGHRCALGSVKSMIGHAKAAAGAAGMIKATLALYHKVMPPTLKVGTPDPKLDIENSPFYLNTTARPWFKANGHPRRSGVSAFGFGGSNFHVVLEEYQPEKCEVAWDGSVELLAFSGADHRSIAEHLTEFANQFADATDPVWPSRAARRLRADFNPDHPYRLVLVVDCRQDHKTIVDQLKSAVDTVGIGRTVLSPPQGLYYVAGDRTAGKLAFLFPGQGSQYPDMGRDLTNRFPEAMAAVQAASDAFDHDPPLWAMIFPPPALSDARHQQQADALRRTDVAQPAIGAISLAMLAVLDTFGVKPDITCGHSYGELPALHAAGWIDRETLLRLSTLRGRLMADAGRNKDAGIMLAVRAPIDALEKLAASLPGVVLANLNSPEQGVLSGSKKAIEAAATACKQKGYKSILLPVAAAFHSPLVQGAQAPFSEAVAKASFLPTAIPVYANVTASPYPEDPSQAADLLGRQLTSPVRFQQTIENLYAAGVRSFIEVGPKAVLSGLVRATLKTDDISVIALDRLAGKDTGMLDLAHTIGQLAALGGKPELTRWERALPEQRPHKMVIPLSGANYRSSRPSPPVSPAPKPADPIETKPLVRANVAPVQARSNTPINSPTSTKNAMPQKTPNDHPSTTPATPRQPAAGMDDALAIVRKGLESIQSLHQQTAQTHQKFLETQAQAGRTLEAMMNSTRIFVESAMGGGVPAAPNQPILPQADRQPVAALTPATPNPATPVPQQAAPARAVASPVVSSPPVAASPFSGKETPSETGDKPADAIASTLIKIVAELTGYPEEMLGLEMDIEADLGIDSIKRVEILSAMEERMPHLPQVTPDMVGTLKTLGQICDFLAAGGPSDQTGPAAVRNDAPNPSSAADEAAIQSTLIKIVAELTGYPEEMLGLEMDIEADLGIDSIKRVEILSAMEERMPHLPQVTPDMVGTLKTLGQICDFLAAGGPSDQTGPAAVRNDAPNPSSAADEAAIQSTLIKIVAELTGYPEEMLGLEMDIEADLGIDSIKRVEILSAMEERMPHLPQVTPDMVGTLKTLGQICDFLAGTPAESETSCKAPETAPPVVSKAPPAETVISRQIVDIVSAPKMPGRPFCMDGDRTVVVVHGGTDLAAALVDQFLGKGIPARAIMAEAVTGPEPFDKAGGVVLCPDVTPETAFMAAKNSAQALLSASQTGDALFAAITAMDGAFGFTGNAFSRPEQGALPGLTKTAGLEWEAVHCRAIDLSATIAADTSTAACLVVDELTTLSATDPIEIGLWQDRRITLTTVPAEILEGSITLNNQDVVVVTGGARGVTAACALALARSTGACMALVGRSAAPAQIPDWLKGIEDEAGMKKAISVHGFAGSRPTPKELETAYRSYAASRAITGTLEAMQQAGVKTAYFSADVTHPASLQNALDAIRRQMGPITTIIHGAGVLHDRLIGDKTLNQFRDVYNTKVAGLQNMLSATKNDDLKYLTLFSSVSARTGNTGQCDYAMANEVLNKMARLEAQQRSDCRVTAINWGPWDGGMVTTSLKKAFGDMQIALIPVETGARMMVAEMNNAEASPVEVVIGSMLTTEMQNSASTSPSPLSLLERRELNLERYPVLASHVIGGRPVVPFALISEWIGHGALKENPGYALHGIDDFRLLSGIRIEQDDKLVRLMAGKATKNGDAWQVDVELRNGVKNGKDVIHSRAKALLVDHFPEAPTFSGNGKNGSHPYPRDLKQIYGDILFHGERLRAIQSIDDYSDHGMTARLVAAPKPEAWMQDPIHERWTADPMVLDGAFQMAIVWCFEQTGKVCLPSYARAYRQYRSVFPSSGVSTVMQVTAHHSRKMVADFTFLDEDNQVVATLSGYEATIDQALMHAFKNNGLPSVINGDHS